MNIEQNFIDQIGLKETLRQLAAAKDDDAFAFLPFQLANEFRRLGGDDLDIRVGSLPCRQRLF